MIRVMIAADLARTRADLRMTLATDRKITVVHEAATFEEIAAAFPRAHPAAVVVQLRRGALADQGVQRILRRLCTLGAKVVLCVSHLDATHLVAALRTGVCAFVFTDADSDDLPTVVHAAVSGKRLPNPEATLRLLARVGAGAEPGSVSPNLVEHQVLACIGAGMPNVEVAAVMGLHPTTTYAYTNHLMTKLQAPSRMQLALYAYERGLVSAA